MTELKTLQQLILLTWTSEMLQSMRWDTYAQIN
jgi:hypothetical protein